MNDVTISAEPTEVRKPNAHIVASATQPGEEHMTEFERMDAGLWYDPRDPEISKLHETARRLCRAFNFAETDHDRSTVLKLLVGEGLGNDVAVNETFQCDFPARLILQDRVFVNYGCKILNCGIVTIGEETRLAPNVTIIAVKHPLDGARRNYEPGNRASQAFPVTIGRRSWICSGAVICPGVTLGDDVVVLANSVVTKDVPSGQVVGGQTAKFVCWTSDYDVSSL